jgi:hypothetical protein
LTCNLKKSHRSFFNFPKLPSPVSMIFTALSFASLVALSIKLCYKIGRSE